MKHCGSVQLKSNQIKSNQIKKELRGFIPAGIVLEFSDKYVLGWFFYNLYIIK